MKIRILSLVAVLMAVMLAIVACGPPPSVGEITYFDEEEVFLYEVDEPESASVVEPRGLEPRGRGNRRRITDFSYRILRVAQIQPVEVDGKSAQANDILIEGNSAYVAYNTAFVDGAADQYAGAFQILDIRSPLRPAITTEIALEHADVNAIAVRNGDLYIAGAWDPDQIADYDPANPGRRAFVAKVPASEIGSVTAEYVSDNKVILDSFAATGIAFKGSTVFVSSGALDGRLTILDDNLAVTDSLPYPDLRDIEEYRGGIVALQGTDQSDLTTGRVLTINQNGTEKDSLNVTDFLSAEKKATIEVYDNKYAFLGLSEGGFETVYLKADSEEGEPVQSVFSIETMTGLDWTTQTDTNSVSYADDLIFTADGEAGFRAFTVTESLDKDEVVSDFASLVGFVPFDETDPDGDDVYWSANHVEYKSILSTSSARIGFLAVASGVGGVNLYYLRTRN